MTKKYEVGFEMTFDKVQEDGTSKPGMRASVQYFDLEYADAVKTEAAIKPTIDALFALGAEQAAILQVAVEQGIAANLAAIEAAKITK